MSTALTARKRPRPPPPSREELEQSYQEVFAELRTKWREDGLTLKQIRWIEELFACGFNGSEAARRVYNAEKDNTAAAISSENLQKPQLQAAIGEASAAIAARAGTPAAAIERELTHVAFARPVATWEEDAVTLIPSAELTDAQLASVQSIKSSRRIYRKGEEEIETRNLEVRQHSKVKALELLGRIRQMFQGDGGPQQNVFVVAMPPRAHTVDEWMERYGRALGVPGSEPEAGQESDTAPLEPSPEPLQAETPQEVTAPEAEGA